MRVRAPRREGLDAFGVADEGPGPRRGRRRLERVRALDSRNARHDGVSHVLSRRALRDVVGARTSEQSPRRADTVR